MKEFSTINRVESYSQMRKEDILNDLNITESGLDEKSVENYRNKYGAI